MRLHKIMPDYQGRVRYRIRAFPLEVDDGESAPRDILQQEWWLAALQEPEAKFSPFQGDDWPTTTLPAFEIVWSATQQGEALAHALDLRIRQAFFAESRNIGRPEVLLELAKEVAGLDLARLTRDFESGAARPAVLEERRIGKEEFRVRGTPTLMLADGTRLRPPIAFPEMRERKIVRVGRLPCCGESCMEATRTLVERALQPGG